MEKPKIFFSYSRDDSEFVLNLAKELRGDGANVWLDQLDIKPGTRWDKSIEDALDASKTVLVILSKTSVESNNVMDEVSYALEEGKTVIPVLLEECDIPFRLRRLQFADFSVSHEKGIQKLTKALGLTDKEAAKPKQDVEEPKKPIAEPQKEEVVLEQPIATTPRDVKKDPSPAPAKESAPKKSKLPIIIGGGIVLVLLILYASGVFSSDKPKKGVAEEAKKEIVTDENAEKEDPYKFDELNKTVMIVAEKIKFVPSGPDPVMTGREFDILAKLLTENPKLKLNIECHVHDQLSAIRNVRLSKLRALTLKKVIESYGIDANRITSQGMGESKPIAPNDTREGKAKNTRVEMTLSKS